jgi:hypothetical protein
LGIGLIIAGPLLLGGCAQGTVQDALGMGKRAPDEFAVVKRAPLIVPPEYDLRPPDPGAPRPNVGRTSDQARVALTGTQAGPSPAARILTGARPSAAGQPDAANDRTSVPAAALADDLLSAGTGTANGAAVAATPGPVAAATSEPVNRSGKTPGELAMVALAGGDQNAGIRRTVAEENQALADVESSLFTRVVKWRDPSSLGATIDPSAEAQRLRDNKVAGRAPTEGDTPTVVNRRQSALQGFLEDIF